jgi:hypothetical protein
MRRRSTTRGRQGDHLVQDDRTGLTCWASETQKEWNGALVHKRFWEARHSQDFVRGVKDNMRVDPARTTPAPKDLPFSGNRQTNIAIAGIPGDYAVVVDSIANFSAGDWIRIFLDSGDVLQTQVLSAPVTIDNQLIHMDSTTLFTDEANSIAISSPLPASVSVGNLVINMSNSIGATLA